MGWGGVEWIVVGWGGVEWRRVGWGGVEWSGVGWGVGGDTFELVKLFSKYCSRLIFNFGQVLSGSRMRVLKF